MPPLTPCRPWKDARILLGVTGGIAAYKSVQLARDLTRLGATVDAILTRGASSFVQPLSFEGVTGRPVHSGLFREDAGGVHAAGNAALHLLLGREADAVCVAPATADFLARAAQGRADDLLTTTLLVTRAPVVVCPAMNDRMWDHPQLRRNAKHLEEVLGYRLAGPGTGPLAYGEGDGPGRMLEPDRIVEHLGRALAEEATFLGRTVLVTAGPTREPVDPVRFVGNRSSGKMGFALARAAWRRGADVVLVTGPTTLEDPEGVETVRVEAAREMEEVVRDRLPEADAAIFAAAVADYRPAEVHDRKLKRSRTGASTAIELVENPDVAKDTRDARRDGAVMVGFALETDDLEANARRKLEEKGFDVVVANPTGDGRGFEAETNEATLFGRDGRVEELPLAPKDEIAERILDRVGELLGGHET